MEKGELPLALLPGAHRVQINWQSDDGTSVVTRLPRVDLEAPSSNIGTVVRIPGDRWVLYAGGSGIGPAILYWGELIVFFLRSTCAGTNAPHAVAKLRMVDPWPGAEYVFLVGVAAICCLDFRHALA